MKLVFGISVLIGGLVALIVGFRSGWSTDLWLLPLIVAIFFGVSIGLVVRRAAREKIYFSRKQEGDSEGRVSSKTILIIELVLFIGLLTCIAMPLSAKRGLLIGDYQVTTRSILIFGAVWVGVALTVKLLRMYRGR